MLPLYVTFVVRLQLDESHSLVSGQISHVGTQESAHFSNLNQAMEFITDYLSRSNRSLEEGTINWSSIFTHRQPDDANSN